MIITKPAARAALFASTALFSLTVAAPAWAQTGAAGAPAAPDQPPAAGLLRPLDPDPFSAGFVPPASPVPNQSPVSSIAPPAHVEPEPQIVIANPGTSTTSRDPTNITGVGQMVVDQRNGSIGLCTGTLINPRAVLFAAHCVNSRAATAYGANSGGVPISFGFQADNLPALQRWFNATIGGQPNPLRYQSNPSLALFNVSQVRYNELSLEPASRSFLYGDIAIATLDTPAAGIPTWAMLFSPLAPTTITAAGTGYDVQLAGYGSHGNASTGSASGSDFRRRLAENVLGALTDLRTFERYIFGSSSSPTQNLYFIDFDDPRRGQAGASTFDFNAFRDNSRGTNEGITAAGDSGGPLILQNAVNMRLAIGVLSGGYTRFFSGQPANGYGTVSFYQPIYLYWDWIAANNPYRYVSNLAGDRRWDDPANWVTTLDPNYMIIGPNGQIVNGVPTTPGEQKNGRTGQFGEICFQTATRSQCLNVATGRARDEQRPIGTEEAGDAPEPDAGDQITRTGFIEGSAAELDAQADGGASNQALPPPTLANGLPGATNFVPNNQDPDRVSGRIGRYFDVSLAAAGTTTLDSTVTVDRFRITAAAARLNIASAGSLTSLIDVTQITGITHVDGRLTSRGDYLLMSGLLSGNGTVATPFLTSVLGTIAPGTLGTIGTLTLQGNLVSSSGSALNIDIGESRFNDRLLIGANGGSTGLANLAGTLVLNPVVRPRFNNEYNILVASGGVRGTFANVTDLRGVLFPVVTYGASSVDVRIDAASFRTLINPDSRTQLAFADLLDANRQNYAALSALYYEFDVLEGAELQQALTGMAPAAVVTGGYLGRMSGESMARFYRDRMTFIESGAGDGQLALIGNPVQFAALERVAADRLEPGVQTDAGGRTVDVGLPAGVSAFIAGGYLDGSSAPLDPTIAARDELDGWFLAAGVEMAAGERSRVGAALHYVDSDGQAGALQQAVGELYQLTGYGTLGLARVNLRGQFSIGVFDLDTTRQATVGGGGEIRGDSGGLAFSGEIGFGVPIELQRLTLTPNGSLRYSHIEFGGFAESGGVTSLTVGDEDHRSLQGRLGMDFGGDFGNGGISVVPRLTAALVHEFLDEADALVVGFAGGGLGGATVPFLRPVTDRNWGELGVGMRIGSPRLSFDISAETTIERSDLRQQTYRAGVSFRF